MASWIWVLIPITAILAGVLKHWLKIKERQLEMTSQAAERFEAQNHRLEDRVQVLERIITDRGMQVSEEIERLRDERIR
jgi:hypothetical protein